MLEARSVALVGASSRPGSLGERALLELERSPSSPKIHLVNPRYGEIGGHECLRSLSEVPEAVDLVLLAVGDRALEEQLRLAAGRGDRSAVIFGSAVGLRDRLAAVARDGGMALCGAGCMGFVTEGLRAVGYLEPFPIPAGPIALVTHSGSAFSALLRARRRLGWTMAVSSGQELVTTTADYLDYALSLPTTGVLALLLETPRDPPHLVSTLRRAAAAGIPAVALVVGGSPGGRALVEAHSGALAGEDAAWEALCEATGLVRVRDLAEMVDFLELVCAGRKVAAAGRGLATVHDSGAERVLAADVAAEVGVPFAPLGPDTLGRLASMLDPGLEPGNPLDVWGRGASTRELFAGALSAMASDPAVGAVALAVDLVPEFDGDESYPQAAVDASLLSAKPFAVLANLPSSIDPEAADRLRSLGVPVLEGTRSGLVALKALLEEPDRLARAAGAPPPLDPARAARWASRIASGGVDGAALLADYGVPVVPFAAASGLTEAMAAAESVGFPCVLKTAGPAVAHKTEVGGVVLGLGDAAAVAAAYEDVAGRLGPLVTLSPQVSGVELAVGVVREPLLGPVVVVAAGGVLAEVLRDRRVALPPFSPAAARRLVAGLRVSELFTGFRGAPPVDLDAVASVVSAVSILAAELGDVLAALDVNPLVCRGEEVVAVDVWVESFRP